MWTSHDKPLVTRQNVRTVSKALVSRCITASLCVGEGEAGRNQWNGRVCVGVLTGAVGHGVEVAIEQQGAARPPGRPRRVHALRRHARHHRLHVAVRVIHPCRLNRQLISRGQTSSPTTASGRKPTVEEGQREAAAGRVQIDLDAVVRRNLLLHVLQRAHQNVHCQHLVFVAARHLPHTTSLHPYTVNLPSRSHIPVCART